MTRPSRTIYPAPDAFIHGVPAVEQEVTAEEAKRLLSYYPVAFTTEPPIAPEPPAEEPAAPAAGE